jgi:hypothetical protein
MFKTCIYCNRNLGGNQTVENFPVGKRLAFDQDKGRLWVICETCRRWNLSPLDERWEAIEECERQFHDTSQSFSTDNIGMARLPEGLELVRIGRPKRPEFAAWRYGREFLRRRIRSLIIAGTQVAVSVGGALVGADIWWVFLAGKGSRVAARARDEDGNRLVVTRKDTKNLELVPWDAPDGWALKVPHRREEKTGLIFAKGKGKTHEAYLTGPTAIRAAGRILPKVNEWGATNAQVKNAVVLLEEARAPERLFARAAEEGGVKTVFGFDKDTSTLKDMDSNTKLALEMAAHEESERRALEGELEILAAAWREAEEVASIADRLLVPDHIEDWIRKYKKKLSGESSR